jgi:hypothetical protein
LQEYVAKIAYKRWQKRGGVHRGDLADWLAAENEAPKKVSLGWRPVKTPPEQGITHYEAGLINWKDLFLDPRYRHSFGESPYRGVATAGWLDESCAMHYSGVQDYEEAPVDRHESLLWPCGEELQERGALIRFHGPVFILWLVHAPHGLTQSLQFIFIKHRDTIWEEKPVESSARMHRCNYGRVYEFPKGIQWKGSKYDI